MVFSSIVFLTWFLPIFLLLYRLADARYKNALLLVGSIVFYAWGAPRFIFVLLGTSFLDFWIVGAMHKTPDERRKKLWLAASLTLNLGLLAYFKYYNFFLENVSAILQGMGMEAIEWHKVVLPLGISFFVFESLTYVIDVYRGVHEPLKRFWDYQMYILYFPKLIAGPIVRYHQIADQVENRQESNELFLTGFYRLVIGLGKKVLIANKLGALANIYFVNDPHMLTAGQAWFGVIAYMMQIYFDFSGYSDMALGLSKMLGFRLPENFNNPFIARNITEFWQRWHISLSTWFQIYLFTPLALQLRNWRLWGVAATIMVTFFASGLWHGASWNFVLWGLMHGIMLVIDRVFLLRVLQRAGRLPGMLFVWVGVSLSFVLFKIDDLDRAWTYFGMMFTGGHGLGAPNKEYTWIFWLAIVLSLLPAIPFVQRLQDRLYADQQSSLMHVLLFSAAVVGFVICLSALAWRPFNPFLYFRF